MEQAHLEPVLIEDLVKFGEDRGFDRGTAQERVRVYESLLEEHLGRPLTHPEQEMLASRIAVNGLKRLNEMLLRSSPAALEAWLNDVTAT